MRERAAATIFMWIALAISIDRILASLKYQEWVPLSTDPGNGMYQTVLVSEAWQIGAAVLIFMLIVAAGGATVAVWQGASRSVETQAERQSEKAKRDNREARIKRLMAALDDDELDLLEQEQLTDEEERLSLESLLRRRS